MTKKTATTRRLRATPTPGYGSAEHYRATAGPGYPWDGNEFLKRGIVIIYNRKNTGGARSATFVSRPGPGWNEHRIVRITARNTNERGWSALSLDIERRLNGCSSS